VRIPFPVKAFLSYLAVIAVGALPTYIYLADVFEDELVQSFAHDAVARANLLGELLAPYASDERAEQLDSIAPLFIERVTYITPNGHVKFDSEVDVKRLDNHAERAEVTQVFGKQAVPARFGISTANIGVSIRDSKSTKVETLYAAVRIDSSVADGIVRLSIPTARISSLSNPVVAAFRNNVAISISLAIILSAVAAVVFLRPLRRLAEAARAIADGNYKQKLPASSRDEVGDVADAVRRMLVDIRERMAVAETASSMLGELVDALPTPVVVLDLADKPLATNGAARRILNHYAVTPEQALLSLLAPEPYTAAVELAHETGIPQQTVLGDTDTDPFPVTVHPVPHPSGSPLTVLVGRTPPAESASVLPQIRDVAGRPALALITEACVLAGRPTPSLDRLAKVLVADATGRTALALAAGLRAAPHAELRADRTERSVDVTMTAAIPESELQLIGLLIEPLGGRIVVEGNTTTLKLAIA
jgi:HAMP domain-containing protein